MDESRTAARGYAACVGPHDHHVAHFGRERQHPAFVLQQHDAAARHVDQDGRRLHQRQFARADQIARAVVQRGVDRDDVGTAQQFGERKRGVRLFAHDARRRGVAYFAAECRRQPRHLAADGAESDDAPFRAVELVGGQCEMELLSGGGVGAALDVTVVIDDLSLIHI